MDTGMAIWKKAKKKQYNYFGKLAHNASKERKATKFCFIAFQSINKQKLRKLVHFVFAACKDHAGLGFPWPKTLSKTGLSLELLARHSHIQKCLKIKI